MKREYWKMKSCYCNREDCPRPGGSACIRRAKRIGAYPMPVKPIEEPADDSEDSNGSSSDSNGGEA